MEGLKSDGCDRRTWCGNKSRGIQVPKTMNDLKLFVPQEAGGWRGCNLQFYFYLGRFQILGRHCMPPFHWVPRDETISLFLVNVGGHGTNDATVRYTHSLEQVQGKSGLESIPVTWNKYAGPGHLNEHPSWCYSCSPKATVPPQFFGEKCSICLEQLFVSSCIQKRIWKTEYCVVLHCGGWRRQLTGLGGRGANCSTMPQLWIWLCDCGIINVDVRIYY